MNNDFFDQDEFAPVASPIVEEENEPEITPVYEDVVEDDEDIQEISKRENIKFRIDKRFIIILSVLAVLFLVIYIFCFSNLRFAENYRTNFITNISLLDEKFGISRSFGGMFGSKTDGDLKKREENVARGTTYDNDSYLMPFENASAAVYTTLNNEVIAAKSNYIVFFNNKGEILSETATSVVNPILCAEGDYVLIAEQGGKKINLFKDKKLVFSADSQNEILNANVSSNGDVVVVTKKELYKGAVEVFNKSGERIYDWSSGKDSIICADIAPSSRKLAVAFIDSTEIAAGSIQFFDIKQSQSYKTVEIPSTVIFKLEFIGESLNVFGDNRFVGINPKGNVLWDIEFNDSELFLADISNSGIKALLSETDNLPSIGIYSKRGSKKREIFVEQSPDYLDVSDNRILYNNSRMIYFGSYRKTKEYPATMDIKNLKIINNNTFLVVYSNSIEFIEA